MSANLFAQLDWHGRSLRVDFSAGRSLAIPLDPHGPQPAFFSPGQMQAEPLRGESFIANVEQGGSCNAELLHWAPHCHGTHTECIGHILQQRLAVTEVVDTSPGLALLHTTEVNNGVIEHSQLEKILDETAGDHIALILRTLPNDAAKKSRNYDQEPDYPVLSNDTVSWLAKRPLKHLLLDTPSLDSIDNGNLDNHRSWWGESGNVTHPVFPARKRSITEMIYVPDEIPDGEYWLHLELSPLLSDATPSRPIIYPTETI